MNADFHKFITECLGLLTKNIDCSYVFLPGFYEMCNLRVRRSDYPKDYQNGRIQEMILVKHSEITKIISNLTTIRKYSGNAKSCKRLPTTRQTRMVW